MNSLIRLEAENKLAYKSALHGVCHVFQAPQGVGLTYRLFHRK